ncbi:restriction endonuclease subunit S [Corynebacterium glutamicum]|uniref:restriction endonuclease subunit S n=1 Tax=Corynebacterium TaxID=1716 RepID=UPI00019623F4|nr:MULTISPECIES: restriction endonuclease subunit S [Corynebacterium]QWQ83006.1 hypothetical protein B5C28_00380 [Corynebacterium glutamicum]WFP71831.1 restriction endonuclease subunit S [Corynebacterium glutamicum]BAV21834.1 type I restriction enzyme EcoKI specificity protein [Corynebacterium glutamicum]BCB33782.1 hypothetical protein KaCgl_17560 [Corynebacterium glutamicum]
MSSVNEWPMVKLGDIQRKVSSINPAKSPDQEFSLYSIPAYDAGAPEKALGSAIKSNKIELQPGDTLLSKIVPHIRRSWIVDEHETSSIGSSEWIVYQDDRLDSRFLRNFFLSDYFHAQFMQTVAGVGGSLNRARPAAVAQISIPIPPRPEQQRIAEILDVTQQQFDLLKARKTHLSSLRTGLVDQFLEADDRETLPLKEIAEIQSGITKGRRVRNGEILTETAYMAVSNVKDGHLNLGTVKTIPATEAEITRFRLKAGDVLLTEGGDPDKLGRGTVWRDEIEPCLHQNHIFRVRLPEDSRFTPEVLMAMLSTKQARAYFFRSAKQTTGIASINKTQLSAVPVPILTDSEIAKLSEALTQIDILSSYIEKRRIATESLHRALSTRAFAGQL